MTISKWQIAMVLIIVLIGGFFGQRYYYELEEKENVERFLQQRYGQVFNAQSCEYYYQSAGGPKGIRTFVISRDQPPVEFFVSRLLDNPRNNFRNYHESMVIRDGKIYFGYLMQKWMREVDVKLQGVAEKVFQQPIIFGSDIHASVDQLRGQTPTFFEMRETHPEVFADKYYSQSFWLLSFYDLNENNKVQETERIFQFMGKLNKLGMQKYMLHINYYLPTYFPEAKKSIEKVGGVMSFLDIDYRYSQKPAGFIASGEQWKYTMMLLANDVDKIKTPSDIIPFIKPKMR